MTYYKDNPNLYDETCITIHGDKEYTHNCRKYPDGWYVKGIDLELSVNGVTWSKKIIPVFDHETKQQVQSSEGLIHGVVAIKEDSTPEYGYFSPNPYNNCSVQLDYATEKCIRPEILVPEFFKEKISEGKYIQVKGWSDAAKARLDVKALDINNNGRPYNIEDVPAIFAKAKALYEGYTFPIDKDLQYVARYLGGLTLGAELETINGTLPDHIAHRYGIVICKDGSICVEGKVYPPEYVFVPLKGAKGLQALRNGSAEIAKRSDINAMCSYHLHIGGFQIDRIMIISLFKLCHKIQNDVFKMFPLYKKNWRLKGGEKNYCQNLPNILNNYGTKDFNKYINDTYSDLYRFLTGGKMLDFDYNRKNKKNPWGDHKWNIKTRYYWTNFVNPVFGKRDTVEFRIHTPTLNADKIINWLLMCAAIIKYAENNVKHCVSSKVISFEDVLNYYRDTFKTAPATKLSKNLIAYYNDRVAYFKKDAEASNGMSQEEMLQDAEFKFPITNIF